MKRNSELTQTEFDNLLGWLSADREKAAPEYENVRRGLINFFRFRGCNEPETLADETITRVARKVTTFTINPEIKTISYFYGFASNVYREYIRSAAKSEVQLDPALPLADRHSGDTEQNGSDARTECLEKCLKTLSPDKRELVLEYYSKEKSEKLELRKQMAEKLGLELGALYIRVYRIRKSLRKCIEECLNL